MEIRAYGLRLIITEHDYMDKATAGHAKDMREKVLKVLTVSSGFADIVGH